MIIKPLAEAITLPTGSGSASTVSNAGLVWVYVSGTITNNGTTTDPDGTLFVVVDAQSGNVVSSIRLAPGSTTRIEKDPAAAGAEQLPGEGSGMEGMGADPMSMGEIPTDPDLDAQAAEMAAGIDQQYTKDTKKADL